MRRMAQFVLALILGLALLTWAASNIVRTTARKWFERDAASKAQLALVGSRQSLANAWYGEPEALKKLLIDIAADDRVMGVAACDSNLTLRASTSGFPEEFGCWPIGSRVRITKPNQ